jgi:hypothetical protein
METMQAEGSAVLNYGMIEDLQGLRNAVSACAGPEHVVTRELFERPPAPP